ncbi:MAG: DUF4131 domain-containing protein [Ruminococcaceae bacterium]|nr:DUF4131 domain-containing protein [Oscillospiraceae bacterium]
MEAVAEKRQGEGMRYLALFAGGYAAALLAAHYLLPGTLLLPAAALMLALLLPAALWKRRRAMAFLLLIAAAAGFLWYWGYTRLFVAPAEAFVGQKRTVTVCVTDYPKAYDDYTRVTVRSVDAAVPHRKMLVYDYDGGMTELRPGDLVDLPLKLTSAAVRYGEESDVYLSDGVLLRGYRSGEYRVPGRSPLRFLFAPKALARAMGTQALQCFPADVAPLMKALLTGDKQEYYADASLSAAMQSAGFSHIVAVSGMHVGFLITALGLLCRSRRRTAVIGMPLVLAFMAMVGFTPSVTRAGIMQCMLLAAPLLRRENDPPTALSAAGLLLLLINPYAIGGAGFQLSFAAMAGLIAVSGRVYKWLAPTAPKNALLRLIAHSICSLLAASAGAMAFTTPIAAWRFGFVPLYGIFTNLLCLWAMSLAFLLGWAVCLIGLLRPAWGAAAGWAVGWLPRYVSFVVRCIARLPYAALFMGTAAARWWLLSVYALFGAAYFLRQRGRPFRPLPPLLASLAGLALLLWLGMPHLPGALELAAIDVGQGQSFAALTKNGTVLIDCGSIGTAENAGDAAAGYLRSYGRGRVDLLILTHFHADHANGVRRLMGLMDVGTLAYPVDCEQNEYMDDILCACRTQNVELLPVTGDMTVAVDGLELRLFAPLGEGDVNEQGLLIRGDWGEFEFLVTGDAGTEVEQKLIERNDLGDLELLVVGHHGSRYSTCDELLEDITPEVAFISVGAGNSYGHPTAEVLRRLDDHGITVYRTDLDGTVSLSLGE